MYGQQYVRPVATPRILRGMLKYRYLRLPCRCTERPRRSCLRSTHHHILLILEAAQGDHLALLVFELEFRRRLSNSHHPQRRGVNILKRKRGRTAPRGLAWREALQFYGEQHVHFVRLQTKNMCVISGFPYQGLVSVGRVKLTTWVNGSLALASFYMMDSSMYDGISIQRRATKPRRSGKTRHVGTCGCLFLAAEHLRKSTPDRIKQHG